MFLYTFAFISLAIVDFRYRVIPKATNLLLVICIPAISGLRGALWAMAIYLLYALIFKITEGAIGYGDVRLAPVTALFTESSPPLLPHLLAWVIAGAFHLYRRGHSPIAFAPFLAGGTMLTLIGDNHYALI